MTRSVLWACLWSTLAYFSWKYGAAAWVPCLGLAGYNLYRAFRPRLVPAGAEVPLFRDNMPLGELKRYVVDGTESLGLFLELANERVFVDIREDAHVEDRKAQALRLFRSTRELESSLSEFRTAYPEFAGRRLTYIGLHAPPAEDCAVFWAPSGHTALRGLQFVN